MAKEMKDLQALINKRAEERLDKDISDLCKVRSHRLLSNRYLLPNVRFADETISKDRMDLKELLYPGGIYTKKLKEAWLPIYITEESELFLNRVEELESQVDDLLNRTQ